MLSGLKLYALYTQLPQVGYAKSQESRQKNYTNNSNNNLFTLRAKSQDKNAIIIIVIITYLFYGINVTRKIFNI